MKKNFRFYDNRQKYLLFVTTTNEKNQIADAIRPHVNKIKPQKPGIKIFDAGMGDGSLLMNVMRQCHQARPNIPLLVATKEISIEDVRLGLEKLPDRFVEHKNTVFVISNLHYAEAANLKSKNEKKQKKKKPTLKDQISELNSQVNDEKDKFLRLFAEFENYRKRTAKERLELFKTASQELMTALLPIADDMDRALSELKKSENDENLQGFELIYSKFNDILKTKGLTQIDVKIGDKFDSENHEAITQIKADKEENKGTVIDIVEKGYKLGEKIIRYPKVVVAI